MLIDEVQYINPDEYELIELLVFLTITRPPVKDDEKRSLYVGMTHPKRKLVILANWNFIKPFSGNSAYKVDHSKYLLITFHSSLGC